MSIRVDDWVGMGCGDTVRERDGRHTGRVEHIENSWLVKVRWHDTRWISYLHRSELTVIERAKNQ